MCVCVGYLMISQCLYIHTYIHSYIHSTPYISPRGDDQECFKKYGSFQAIPSPLELGIPQYTGIWNLECYNCDLFHRRRQPAPSHRQS